MKTTNEKQKTRLCIFSGSRATGHQEEVARIGTELPTDRYCVTYGGGHEGMMGVVPRVFAERGGEVRGHDFSYFAEKDHNPPDWLSLPNVRTEV